MALTESLDAFLADFGVSVTAGSISGVGILDMPTQIIAAGQVLSTDYALTCRADQFGTLLYGDSVTVNGTGYSVRETRLLDDGMFVEISLSKLAPDATAPGGNPAQFSLNDISDVSITNPGAGEVLTYNGSEWVDAEPNQNAAFVFVQSTPLATWVINHNLGFKPSVELLDQGGNEFDADVLHTSINQVVVYLSIPATGTARLN